MYNILDSECYNFVRHIVQCNSPFLTGFAANRRLEPAENSQFGRTVN
jgi:hypothetical protein